ncbi:acyltransferase [Bremerella cremea]|uniref:Acetyltransferase n=1 Tax=Blastopirellula marina TaxID=124 RepID=A0A2S8FL04_9BACT|nr:acetyltransferase [Blastopirellula marina]RCS45913.1 acyltransferase [Bremerella cremea]
MNESPKPKRGLLSDLNKFIWLQRFFNRIRLWVFTRIWGMDISPTAVISLSAKLDKTNPKGVHIGSHTYVAFQSVILAHDMCRRYRPDTRIGSNCFIGGRSIVMPGITVGDGSIVGAGSVVTKDVPPGSIVAGNPAKVIRTGISVGPFGVLRPAVEPADKDASVAIS